MAYSMGHAIASMCVSSHADMVRHRCLHYSALWTGITTYSMGYMKFADPLAKAFSYMVANTGGVPVQVTSTMFSFSFGQCYFERIVRVKRRRCQPLSTIVVHLKVKDED